MARTQSTAVAECYNYSKNKIKWQVCCIRFFQGFRMKIYIPQKITAIVKNRLHSRQQPCRLRGELRAPRSLQVPRLTVIGIGLRKISTKFCLPSVRAARRHYRCLAFRLFYFILYHFYVYTIFHAEALGVSRQPKEGIYSGIKIPGFISCQ